MSISGLSTANYALWMGKVEDRPPPTPAEWAKMINEAVSRIVKQGGKW